MTARFVSSQGLLHGLVLCDIVGGGVDLGGGGWIAPRTSAHDCRGHGLVRGLQNLCSVELRAVHSGDVICLRVLVRGRFEGGGVGYW